MTNEVESINAIEGTKKSSSASSLGNDLFHDKHVVKHISYAIIVMEVLNKVGLQHQQRIMQIRGKLMDVMTRMQNDFTTISQYLSQIENNSHSGGAAGTNEHSLSDWGTDAFNGLSNNFYHDQATGSTSHGGTYFHHRGTDNKLNGFTETVSDSFKTSSQGFINAVKDLFFGSPNAAGLSVGDISKIASPHGGPVFDFSKGPNGGYWGQLQRDFGKAYPGTGSKMIMTKSTDSPSLLQQYMYYKTQVDIYTLPKKTVAKANGQVYLLENFNPDGEQVPGRPSQDALLGTFTELLSALNTPISANRNTGLAAGCKSAPSLLNLIDSGVMKSTYQGGMMHDESWHTGVSGSEKHYDYQMWHDQVKPGFYMAISFMAFNYFWTKNPNASTDQNVSGAVIDSGTSNGYAGTKGAPSSDPLSSLYMTNNSVQTNISQMSSQSNNNFQSDVNVSGQLDNMGVNATKSFFEGTSTMNRNSRIS